MGTGEYQYAYPVLAAGLERDDKGSYTPWLAQKVDTPGRVHDRGDDAAEPRVQQR